MPHTKIKLHRTGSNSAALELHASWGTLIQVQRNHLLSTCTVALPSDIQVVALCLQCTQLFGVPHTTTQKHPRVCRPFRHSATTSTTYQELVHASLLSMNTTHLLCKAAYGRLHEIKNIGTSCGSTLSLVRVATTQRATSTSTTAASTDYQANSNSNPSAMHCKQDCAVQVWCTPAEASLLVGQRLTAAMQPCCYHCITTGLPLGAICCQASRWTQTIRIPGCQGCQTTA